MGGEPGEAIYRTVPVPLLQRLAARNRAPQPQGRSKVVIVACKQIIRILEKELTPNKGWVRSSSLVASVASIIISIDLEKS